MNTWLYRAAGTVGIAGGFLLLAAGGAHADQRDHAAASDELLADLRSPTSGLLPLQLATLAQPATAPGTAAAGTLTLDPADGRDAPVFAGEPEVLPDLGGLAPLGLPLGLDELLRGVPLDAVGLPGGRVGAGLPVDQLVNLDGQPVSLPGLPLDTNPRTLPALAGGVGGGTAGSSAGTAGPPAEQLPAEQLAAEQLAGGDEEIIGALPLLGQPTGGLPASPLSLLSLADQVPLAGPMVHQQVANLPLAGDLLSETRQATGSPLDMAGEVTGAPLPALIADQVHAEGLYSPELLSTPGGLGLPLVGPALAPIGALIGVGNLPAQLPLAGPMLGPVFGGLPVTGDPLTSAPPTSAPLTGGALTGGAGSPALAGDRPIVGEDPEFAGDLR